MSSQLVSTGLQVHQLMLRLTGPPELRLLHLELTFGTTLGSVIPQLSMVVQKEQVQPCQHGGLIDVPPGLTIRGAIGSDAVHLRLWFDLMARCYISDILHQHVLALQRQHPGAVFPQDDTCPHTAHVFELSTSFCCLQVPLAVSKINMCGIFSETPIGRLIVSRDTTSGGLWSTPTLCLYTGLRGFQVLLMGPAGVQLSYPFI